MQNSLKKTRIAILCGGQSQEHEISILSTQNVIKALDKNKYDISLILINKSGAWRSANPEQLVGVEKNANQVTPAEDKDLSAEKKSGLVFDTIYPELLAEIDVAFPILHGPYGEDGTVQGLLKLANIPFVGSDVLSSAICMDKDITKRLLREAGILVAKNLVYRKAERAKISFSTVAEALGLPFFVKPANLGSSIGISKVHSILEFEQALDEAFTHDSKILFEEFIQGREIECSVLGNDFPMASLPGELVSHHEFYSYQAKYFDKDGATITIPANLSETSVKQIQELAIRAFKLLGCSGMARVDFFYKSEQEIYLNEVNTIPGFTNNSMYPKLWEASGIDYPSLIEKLVEFSLEKFAQQKQTAC